MPTTANTQRTGPIDAATVERVYTGRPGCACGCRGNYSERRATISLVVNRLNALGPKWHEEGDIAWADNEEGTRTYTAYLRAGV